VGTQESQVVLLDEQNQSVGDLLFQQYLLILHQQNLVVVQFQLHHSQIEAEVFAGHVRQEVSGHLLQIWVWLDLLCDLEVNISYAQFLNWKEEVLLEIKHLFAVLVFFKALEQQ